MDWFSPVVLDGPTLQLAPLTVADAADYLAALGSDTEAAEICAHLSFHPPRTAAETSAHLRAATGDPSRIPYAQRVRATGELLGTTSFYEVNPATRAIAIGHTWLRRSAWRGPVNTESKLIMLGRAFDGLGAERVVWHTDIRNLRSQAAIERLGARREGVLRHHRIRRDGSWRDTVQFSMLSAEWPAARERLSARG